MNKRIFGILVGLTAMAAIGSASIVNCPAPPPGAVVVATVGGGVSATTYTCAGLTFSNFLVTDALNVPAGTSMALVSATFDNVLGIVNLGFNPNLTLQALVQDIHFSFQVTGESTSASCVFMTVFEFCSGELSSFLYRPPILCGV